jgi:hypothetical protein
MLGRHSLLFFQTDPLPYASSALPACGLYWHHRRRIFKKRELGRHCQHFYLQIDPHLMLHVPCLLVGGGNLPQYWQHRRRIFKIHMLGRHCQLFY